MRWCAGRRDTRTSARKPGKSGDPLPLPASPSIHRRGFVRQRPPTTRLTVAAVAELVADCRKCRLCESRTHTVPGEGPADARLVVIGEGPGRTEDETGRPFVGKAGELLTKILAAIELPREQVFICNVVKCRPPENRLPQYDEVTACVPYLFRQIELVKPKVILAMGGTAAQTLLNTKQSLGSLRTMCTGSGGFRSWLPITQQRCSGTLIGKGPPGMTSVSPAASSTTEREFSGRQAPGATKPSRLCSAPCCSIRTPL